MPDYLAKARALRAKAADPVVPPAESAALLEKARELEAKYRNGSSPFTNDTTVTGRDGFTFFGVPPFGSPEWDKWAEAIRKERQAQAQRVADDLLRNQWRWNTEYYDQFGRPRPQRSPDHDDIMEETYKFDPEDDPEDEDYGYDEYQK